jgi:hypothetical protein
MSFTSHTFTSLPLVHTPNSNFWGNVFDLASNRFASLLFIETSRHHNLRIWFSIDSRISQIPVPDLRRFEILDLHRFATSEVRRFEIPDLHRFATSGLRGFETSDLRRFVTSGLRRFETSYLRRFKIPNLCKFNHPENSFHEFRKTRRFEGDRFSWIPQHRLKLKSSQNRKRRWTQARIYVCNPYHLYIISKMSWNINIHVINLIIYIGPVCGYCFYKEL